MMNFELLGLSKPVLRAISELGFENPTPIQEQAIPVMLGGNQDVVALAQTGTGKTAAFGLPLVDLLDFSQRHTQALILAPTRELCMQITRDLHNFSKHVGGAHVLVYPNSGGIATHARAGNLFKVYYAVKKVLVGATVRLVVVNAQKAKVAHAFPHLFRYALVGFPFSGLWPYFSFNVLADSLAKYFVVLVKIRRFHRL